jgi:8-oxo-dGTP diphosphatase
MRPTAVDAVVIDNDKILLVKRKFEPYKGMWATPGGFVDDNESVEQAVVREALEETGIKVNIVRVIGVYSDPARDTRRTISVAFIAKPTSKKAVGGDDAAEARWFKLDELPPLAFDHAKIVEDARRML